MSGRFVKKQRGPDDPPAKERPERHGIYTSLERPVIRRIGRLLVRISAAGVEVRAIRKRTWRKAIPWDKIAKLALELDCPNPAGLTAKQWEKPLAVLGAD